VTPQLERAYSACRSIAREQAKNFYYAFLALPREKRNGICAVYAFMRRADDLSDDESMPRAARRAALNRWLDGWRQALASGVTEDPVFLALLDTRRRFAIPPALLEELVQGTAMDLTNPTDLMHPSDPSDLARPSESAPPFDAAPSRSPRAEAANGSATLATYATFADLYRYCYLVASVVGLVCIRIFGYTDPQAEEWAEQTGIAFQLTNILRDVREDAERGRVYLPLEDLERCGVTVEQLVSIHGDRQLTQDEWALMSMESARAHEYYGAAESLLPLIAADSRAALWVLVTIYRRLLERMEEAQFQVFSQRVKVPTLEKTWILLRGLWMAFRLRSAQASSANISNL